MEYRKNLAWHPVRGNCSTKSNYYYNYDYHHHHHHLLLLPHLPWSPTEQGLLLPSSRPVLLKPGSPATRPVVPAVPTGCVPLLTEGTINRLPGH